MQNGTLIRRVPFLCGFGILIILSELRFRIEAPLLTLTGTRNAREFLQPHEKTPADHAGVLDYLFHRSETDVFSVEQCIGLVLDAVHAVVCGIHCCIDRLSVAGG